MTQSSEERAPVAGDPQPTARILPFERPQSELQRAVQQRAQEHIEAEQIKPKVSTVRRIMTLAAALVPVVLLFSGFLIAIQAVRFITSLYATQPEPEAPPAVEEPAEPPTPGVIMLVPDRSISPDPPKDAPAASDGSAAGPEAAKPAS